MPVSLPPISRRRFLARSLVAGTGLALSPRLIAAAKPVEEKFWALLSDTHIAADRATVARTVNMAGHLTTVARELVALPARPAGVIVCGDCAYNSGEKADYTTLTDLLAPLRQEQMSVCLTLGNHDQREHFREALKDDKTIEQQPVADRNVALLRSRRVNWFVLDSLDKTLSVPGLIGEQQLDWLAKSLDANPDKPAVVLVHHNPDKKENIDGLKDTDALFRTIRPRKQVKAYIFGHTHNWTVTKDESGIHLINLPPVAYVFREGRPSGWVRATLNDAGMRLELRCVDPAHSAHGDVHDLQWRS